MNYQELEIRKPVINTSVSSKPRRIILQGNEYTDGIPASLAARNNGIRLSTESGTFYMNNDDLSTGLGVIGATGNGKTTFFFNLLDGILPHLGEDDVVFIFDSKGDYKERYYSRNNPDHIIISQKSADYPYARNWNIFGELIDENGMFGPDTEIIAGEISKALFKGMESDSQPFFNLAADDIFNKVLQVFVRDAKRTRDYSQLNNEFLIDYVSSVSNQDLLSRLCQYKDFTYLQSYVGNGQSNQALGVYGYLMSMKNRSFISSLRHKLPSGEFSIRRLVREKGRKIVFLEYDVKYSEVLSNVFSLFFDLAIKEALSGGNGKTRKGNTYFVCDELNLIPNVSHFEELLNFGRSNGCKTMVGIQSVSQLEKNYGEAEADSILAGLLTAVCFNCVDYPTREYIKKRFGETFEAYNFGGSNITREGFTVTDSDIINLRVGEAFIDMKHTLPFKVRFTDNG